MLLASQVGGAPPPRPPTRTCTRQHAHSPKSLAAAALSGAAKSGTSVRTGNRLLLIPNVQNNLLTHSSLHGLTFHAILQGLQQHPKSPPEYFLTSFAAKQCPRTPRSARRVIQGAAW